ncbi:hypothetical protein [Soonwooa purpurea]
MENTKIDVITVRGIMKLYNVSRSTVYNKYRPKLDPIPTKDQKVYFDYEEVKKIHEKLKNGTENFNVIA